MNPETRLAAPTAPPSPRRAVAIVYGIVCHVLFVAAVATMIGMMYFGMSRSIGRLPAPWSWIANGLLLLQFPVLHSLLLSSPGRRMLVRLAPPGLGPPLVTTTYVIVASMQTLFLFALWSPCEIVWWRAEGATLALMICLYTASWLLLLKSIVDAGIGLQTGFLGWWSIYQKRAPVYPPMPTRGLFALCRQPIYVAFTLTVWTVPTWTPDQLVVAMVLSVYCVIGPRFKEARFRRLFGEAFERYCGVVPYWLPFGHVRGDRRPLNDLSIYDRFAGAWWTGDHRWLRTLRNLVPARLEHFDRLVPDWRGRRILDLGCGGGFMAEALAARGAVVTGVDPSEKVLAVARAHGQGQKIDYRRGVAEAIPAHDASFDHVVCVDVLEHVGDLERVIAEVRRVLRPGGLFLFDTIDRTWIARVAMILLGERILRLLPPGTHDPQKFIRPDELRAYLVRHGFEVGRFEGLGPRGLGRRLDIQFGLLPTTAIMYIGSAVASARPA